MSGREIWLQARPFVHAQVTLALEAGVDGIITDPEHVELVRSLGRVEVRTPEETTCLQLDGKASEEEAVARLKAGEFVILTEPWEIIPVENILAQCAGLALLASSKEQALVAAGILEKGADRIVLTPQALPDIKAIVAAVKLERGRLELVTARLTGITPAGLGHRVCVDTLSRLTPGQGMLVGDSSAFTFLVQAETEQSPYVAPRPFRINAGAVHSYAFMPNDRTCYLDELKGGAEVLIVGPSGQASAATIGRVKVEIRPMLRIEATHGQERGSIFLQNAETIRLTRPDGRAVSVTALSPGDEVLCRLDQAGRHFGMKITESIEEN